MLNNDRHVPVGVPLHIDLVYCSIIWYPIPYHVIHVFGIGFIECFTTTFLHTHNSLLAKLGRWGWLMRMRLAWTKSQKTLDISKNTSKWDPKHRECGQRTWFPTLPLLGTADSGTGRHVTPWRVIWEGKIHSEVVFQGLLLCLMIIYNRPPLTVHW